MDNIILSINDMRMSYGDNEVLKGINLDVHNGEKVVIMGPSGSGKSTLLRCINHLEKTSNGEMHFDGKTINLKSWDKEDINNMRMNTSMVFQNYNLFNNKTVLENVTEGLIHVRKMNKKEAEEIACEYLNRTGMLEYKDVYPSRLSGGQKQRVGIARALAIHPKIVMFDEPTSALDPELVGEVLNVIKQVANAGITMLVVTHEVAFAKEVADTVVIIDSGVIIEKGPASQVLNNSQNPRTRKFLNMLDYDK